MAVSTKTITMLAVAAVIAGIGGSWFASQMGGANDPFAECRRGVVSGGGALGGAFTLVDENGNTVTDQQVFTRPSLLYFGYTYCPDVCPLDTARNAAATDILEEMGFDVQPVFVSVDPKRDTPEVVRQFTDILHPKMLGLTGSEDQIAAAAKAYRAYYSAQESVGDDYLVDHSTSTYLVLPGTGYAEFFSRDVPPQDMADRVACFLRKSG